MSDLSLRWQASLDGEDLDIAMALLRGDNVLASCKVSGPRQDAKHCSRAYQLARGATRMLVKLYAVRQRNGTKQLQNAAEARVARQFDALLKDATQLVDDITESEAGRIRDGVADVLMEASPNGFGS